MLTVTKHDTFPGPNIMAAYPILRELLERMFNKIDVRLAFFLS